MILQVYTQRFLASVVLQYTLEHLENNSNINQFTQQSSKPQHSYFRFSVSQNCRGQRLPGTTCCTPSLIARLLNSA